MRRHFVVIVCKLLCLIGLVAGVSATAVLPSQAEPAEVSKNRTDFVFAVSWQPGFCETQPKRRECVGQTRDRFDATHFSLHGLWPVRKSYCGVSEEMKARGKSDWMALPEVAMGGKTAARLLVAMPGAQSGLDRHQWLRSGSCQTASAEDYFALQLRLLDEFNASRVQALFAERIGGAVTENDVKQAFDVAFGKGAGERVRMRCRKDGGRDVITGLTIGLSNDGAGALPTEVGLAGLILAAGTTDFKCARGIVDAAGMQ